MVPVLISFTSVHLQELQAILPSERANFSQAAASFLRPILPRDNLISH